MFRSVAGLVGWPVVLAVAVVTGVWHQVNNYASMVAALELSGAERLPLWKDPLVGWLMTLFADKATFTMTRAAGLALVELLGLFFTAHYGFRCADACLELARARRRGDQDAVFAMTLLLVQSALFLLLVAVPTALVISYEMSLDAFRGLVGATGADGAKALGLDAGTLADTKRLAIGLARQGALACAAATLASAAVIELSARRFHECAAITGDWAKRNLGIADAARPAAAPARAAADATPPRTAPAASSLRSSATRAASAAGSGEEPEAAEDPTPRDVVGGGGVRVTLAEARADPARFHVDGSRRIWARRAWEETQ